MFFNDPNRKRATLAVAMCSMTPDHKISTLAVSEKRANLGIALFSMTVIEKSCKSSCCTFFNAPRLEGTDDHLSVTDDDGRVTRAPSNKKKGPVPLHRTPKLPPPPFSVGPKSQKDNVQCKAAGAHKVPFCHGMP